MTKVIRTTQGIVEIPCPHGDYIAVGATYEQARLLLYEHYRLRHPGEAFPLG